MKATSYTVYALVDPRCLSEYRYIGITGWPELRLKNHMEDARLGLGRKRKWLRSLARKGIKVTMVSLEILSTQDLEREKYWIKKMIADGHPLLNVTHGRTLKAMRYEPLEEDKTPPIPAERMVRVTDVLRAPSADEYREAEQYQHAVYMKRTEKTMSRSPVSVEHLERPLNARVASPVGSCSGYLARKFIHAAEEGRRIHTEREATK